MPKQSGSIDLTAEKEASQVATTYITRVTDAGIRVHAENNPTTDYAGIDATGLEVVQGGASVAKFGASARIGKASDAHVVVKPTYLMETTPSGTNLFEVGRILDDDGYADYVDVEKPSEDTSVFALTHRGQTIKGYTYDSQTAAVTINPLTVSVDGTATSAYTLSAVAEASGDVVYVTLNTAAVAGSVVQIAYRTTATAVLSMQFGRNAQATGECSSAFGVGSIASGTGALAEGGYYTVNGDLTDYYNGGTAKGEASHAEGVETIASGRYSHAEGYRTMASKPGSHAEGDRSTASGSTSHAEGFGTKASGTSAHAEGDTTTASNFCAHAEGSRTTASGGDSHAEGYGTTASGWTAHAQNFYTTAGYSHQTTIGKYNSNQSDNAFEIGNGTSDSARSNAFEVSWDGNVTASGHIRDTDITAEWSTLGSITATTRSCRRSGNVVTVTGVAIDLGGALSASASVDVGTVPADYRPKVNTYAQAFYSSGDLGSSYFRLDANGKLTFRAAKAVGAAVTAAFTMTFVV